MGFFGFGSSSKNKDQAYDQKTGSDYSGIYKSPNSSVGSTVLMDIGLKPKTSSYYAEMSGRKAFHAKTMASMGPSNKSDDGPGLSSAASRKQPTAAELAAQRKAEALEKRRVEGAASRKEFEKKKGERVLALRKRYLTLLNLQ